MKILVTGASGFLGSHVAEQIGARGDTCVALVRKTSQIDHLKKLANVEFAYGTIEDADSVKRAAEGCDAIVHSAGLTKARSEGEFMGVNVEGTRNALDAALAQLPNLKRFVHVSSLALCGPSEDGSPIDPKSEKPLTPYGRSKLAAEKVVREYEARLPVTILRPSYIYGPRDAESLPIYKSVKQRFLPYLGDGTNTVGVIYGPDAAAACLRAIEKDVPSGSTYFVDSGEYRPWIDMLKDIEAAVGNEALVRLPVPFPVFRVVAMASEIVAKVTGRAAMLTREKVKELAAPHWVCDASPTRRDLDWEPKVSWAEGTKKAAEWYRASGWL